MTRDIVIVGGLLLVVAARRGERTINWLNPHRLHQSATGLICALDRSGGDLITFRSLGCWQNPVARGETLYS